MTMDILAESAVRITVLALGVAVVLRGLRVRSPRLEHGAWTAVVAVMLALPAVVAWGPAIEIPILTAAPAVEPFFAPLADRVDLVDPARPPLVRATAARASGPITWTAIVIAIYLAGAVILLARVLAGAWRVRALRRTAVDELGHLVHSACVTPVTVGVLSPAVILPPDWVSWDHAELSAVLAHEEEHVRRRDPLVMALALLNRAIFWFHPLAWWLPRELSRLSEQACDAAVVSRGHDGDVYASCLLRFARRAAEAGGRVMPMAAAMSGAGLRQRLRLLAGLPAPLSRARRLAAIGACAALAVACAAAVPVEAQRRALMPGRLTSEHFEIFHPGLPLVRVDGALRDAEAAYRQLAASLRYEIAWSIPIILVEHDGDLPTNAADASDLALRSGAPNRRRVVLSLESLDRRMGIMVHELTHQFAFEILPATSRSAPLLIEGLAEYQRGAWREDDLLLTASAVAAGQVPSVATLESNGRNWAHAVFDYVAAEQGGTDGVLRLLFALRSQTTMAQAVPAAFGITLDQFDQGFRDYVEIRFRLR
jgi:beta-lactamase regulating signal transducer with metallopeptidase domain